MLTENTITKLQEMRLSTMANAFKEQLADPNISELSFEDRFGLLVDKEWTTRKNNHLTKLIKKANFADTGACVEDIAYDKARKLDKSQINLTGRSGHSSAFPYPSCFFPIVSFLHFL